MVKLVLSDMDNTLLPAGSVRVSDRALSAIDHLVAQGVRFGPATGRDVQELLPFFSGRAEAFSTGIVSNGKKVFADGELVQLTLMDNAALQRLAETLFDMPATFVVAYPYEIVGGNPVWCAGAKPGDVECFLETMARAGAPLSFQTTVVKELPDEPIIAAAVACAGSQEMIDEVKLACRRLVPELAYVQPFIHWCDVLPADLDKSTALPVLLDTLDIAADEVIFFGDSENDLTLMAAIPNSVAVANASPEASAAARWHIGASQDDAVAAALEEIAEAIAAGTTPRFMRV